MRNTNLFLLVLISFVLCTSLVGAQSFYPLTKSSHCDPLCPLEVFLGYASNLGSPRVDETFPTLDEEGSLTYSTTHEVYLGLGLPITFTERAGVRLAGGVTIPATYQADSYDDDFTPVELARQYHSETVWGTLEAMAVYEVRSGFTALAGFRWDNWQSKFTNPRINPAYAGVLAPTDNGDLMLNAFMPMLGVMSNTNGFTLGLMGFPFAFGSYTDHSSATPLVRVTRDVTFSEGYYLEVFFDTSFAMAEFMASGLPGTVSFYAKANFFEARGSGSLIERNSTGASTSLDMDSTFRRTMLVIGAKAQIEFDIAGLTSHLPF